MKAQVKNTRARLGALIMGNNILGCFTATGFIPNMKEKDFTNLDNSFKDYIWGETGISNKLKKLEWIKYGGDMELILFQFQIKPYITQIPTMKDIEGYRKKEKAVGINIIVNDENFFNKNEADRQFFLKEEIFRTLELLKEKVKKKKLDTNMDLLISDLHEILD